MEAEKCQSCTGNDEEPHGNDSEEPCRDIKNYPWEYCYKRSSVGNCPGLSDDPEENPRHKTLRTENVTAWSTNRVGGGEHTHTWRWIY